MPKSLKIQESQVRGWRRKNLKTDDEIPLIDATLTRCRSLPDLTETDKFQKKVAEKLKIAWIGRQAAEVEVETELIVEKTGSADKALLHFITNASSESKLQKIMNDLIHHRGANTSFNDPDLGSPLHLAVAKKMKGITAKLLENGAQPVAFNKDGKLPLHTAIDNENDDIGALLLANMPNKFVRNLFLKTDHKPAELSFHKLLQSGKMKRTILSVLDCLIESEHGCDDIKVYYNILECDDEGRAPGHDDFNPDSKTAYQIIAKQGIKSFVYHDAVRLLTMKKWKEFAQLHFQMNSILYLISLFCLTFSAVVGVTSSNPTSYQGTLQLARAVLEVISIIMVVMTVLLELHQFGKHRLEYFTYTFNWFESLSSILLLCVIPLRFTDNNAQWHVFAFGFILWTIRIFKYAAVFRQTGAYAQILSRVLVYDFIPFGLVFLVILLAFSVSFYLSLRGDMGLNVHNETSTFWGILFVSVRSLTEAQPVVEYTGEDGYGTVSVILMLFFLFTCIVIMMNILIAQMTDTYQKVQQDAQRGLEVNRALIAARLEMNSIFRKRNQWCRNKRSYVDSEEIPDLNNVLIKWEGPPLNEMNRAIADIWDLLDNHKLNLLTVQQRQARQDVLLQRINSQIRSVAHESHMISLAVSPPNKQTNKPTKAAKAIGKGKKLPFT